MPKLIEELLMPHGIYLLIIIAIIAVAWWYVLQLVNDHETCVTHNEGLLNQAQESGRNLSANLSKAHDHIEYLSQFFAQDTTAVVDFLRRYSNKEIQRTLFKPNTLSLRGIGLNNMHVLFITVPIKTPSSHPITISERITAYRKTEDRPFLYAMPKKLDKILILETGLRVIGSCGTIKLFVEGSEVSTVIEEVKKHYKDYSIVSLQMDQLFVSDNSIDELKFDEYWHGHRHPANKVFKVVKSAEYHHYVSNSINEDTILPPAASDRLAARFYNS
jgi:hypothetical protein